MSTQEPRFQFVTISTLLWDMHDVNLDPCYCATRYWVY